jgi:hypothetical protein
MDASGYGTQHIHRGLHRTLKVLADLPGLPAAQCSAANQAWLQLSMQGMSPVQALSLHPTAACRLTYCCAGSDVKIGTASSQPGMLAAATPLSPSSVNAWLTRALSASVPGCRQHTTDNNSNMGELATAAEAI